MIAISLEKEAKFARKKREERGYWHKIPLGDDEVNSETYEVVPRLITSFRMINQATIVISLEVGAAKSYDFECKLDRISTDSFESHYLFDKNHF